MLFAGTGKMKLNHPAAFGLSMLRSWQMMAETASATRSVLQHRSKIIADAVARPMDADTDELSRLVPEKARAFSRAGRSLSNDAQSLTQKMRAQQRDLSRIAARGGLPTAAELQRLTHRGLAIMRASAIAGTDALSPVHATVTANARRLRRKTVRKALVKK
jgi:L-serine deaminase